MGIVAFCPQGHRVKVKDHLAGKKGVCPTCGSRFRIPRESVAEPPVPLPLARVIPLDPAVIATLPRALVAEPSPRQPARRASRTVASSAAAMPRTRHEMLDEQPDLTWSTAVAGGVATALISAAEMRVWLDSGEAVGTELVWRADWPDWRPLTEVFPDANLAGRRR